MTRVVLGDFNLEQTNPNMFYLLSGQNFIIIIKANTCLKEKVPAST